MIINTYFVREFISTSKYNRTRKRATTLITYYITKRSLIKRNLFLPYPSTLCTPVRFYCRRIYNTLRFLFCQANTADCSNGRGNREYTFKTDLCSDYPHRHNAYSAVALEFPMLFRFPSQLQHELWHRGLNLTLAKLQQV